MRGSAPDLPSPHPLGAMLPAVYMEDDLAQRFCDGLDHVLSPIIASIYSFDAYIDPRLAPPDYLEWLSEWLGLTLDHNSTEARRRALVGRAAHLYRWWGTARGISEQVALHNGVSPEVIDSGGVVWSATPGQPLPGSDDPEVTVRLRVADPGAVDVSALESLLAECTPAHVAYRVEVQAL